MQKHAQAFFRWLKYTTTETFLPLLMSVVTFHFLFKIAKQHVIETGPQFVAVMEKLMATHVSLILRRAWPP